VSPLFNLIDYYLFRLCRLYHSEPVFPGLGASLHPGIPGGAYLINWTLY